MTAPDLQRRFSGVSRLFGAEGAERIARSHACVVGVGGVGSWAVEALARTGVGALTLVDLDMVAESNTNRQIQALDDFYGAAKVEVLAERVRAINPACRITVIEEFVTPENVSPLLAGPFDGVLDAIDQVRAKVAMIAHCHARGMPIVTAGAAGGQVDPIRIARCDLAQTVQDPLLAKVRSALRRWHQFPRDPKRKFGVTAIYSTEPLRYPASAGCASDGQASGLNCAGFGSSVCVTASFGLAAAAALIERFVAS